CVDIRAASCRNGSYHSPIEWRANFFNRAVLRVLLLPANEELKVRHFIFLTRSGWAGDCYAFASLGVEGRALLDWDIYPLALVQRLDSGLTGAGGLIAVPGVGTVHDFARRHRVHPRLQLGVKCGVKTVGVTVVHGQRSDLILENLEARGGAKTGDSLFKDRLRRYLVTKLDTHVHFHVDQHVVGALKNRQTRFV